MGIRTFLRRWKYTITVTVLLLMILALIVLRYMLLAHYHLLWWLL